MTMPAPSRPARRPPTRLVAALTCALPLAACAAAPPGPTIAPTPAASATPAATPAASAAPSAATPAASPNAPAATASASVEPFAGCPSPPDAFVNRAPGSGKTVALTFDDGPAPADPEILRVLAEEGVHATFFLTGAHAAAAPGTVREIAQQGHLIAGHSWEHQYPAAVDGGWTTGYLRGQLTRTAALLAELAGAPVCYFRPPGGHTDHVLDAAGALGVTSVMWSVDAEDWAQPGRTTAAATKTIVANATRSPGSHPVVLLHSGKASHEPDAKVSPYRGNTVAALPAIIDFYRARGYRFVLLDGAE